MAQPNPTVITPWKFSVQKEVIEWMPKRFSSVATELEHRANQGRISYGTYLGKGNPGRDGAQDLREELLDAIVYAWDCWHYNEKKTALY